MPLGSQLHWGLCQCFPEGTVFSCIPVTPEMKWGAAEEICPINKLPVVSGPGPLGFLGDLGQITTPPLISPSSVSLASYANTVVAFLGACFGALPGFCVSRIVPQLRVPLLEIPSFFTRCLISARSSLKLSGWISGQTCTSLDLNPLVWSCSFAHCKVSACLFSVPSGG